MRSDDPTISATRAVSRRRVSAPASSWTSSKRSSTSRPSLSACSWSTGQILVGVDQAVLRRLDHRPQRREGRSQIVTRPGDQLTTRVEELLERLGHRVERLCDSRELAGPSDGGARTEITGGDGAGRVSKGAQWSRDRPRERKTRDHRGGRGCSGDREDLHVGAHVEHHPAGEQHRTERDDHGEKREARELKLDAPRPPQCPGDEDADAEARAPDDEGEPDHAANR